MIANKTRQSSKKRTLLLIQTYHTHASILKSKHEEMIYQTDLGGYFNHVYTLYPTVGSDLDQPIGEFTTKSRVIKMNKRHTFIEYKMSYLNLSSLPMLDFIISQSLMLRELKKLKSLLQIVE